MTAPSGALLSPAELEGVRGLELAARVLARSARAGGHPSPFLGSGEEFDRHRPYQQGDDLRHLDWRLYGRSNRLYLRRYRERAAHPTWLLLDRSPSMGWSAGGRVSKLRWSAILAAAVGHLLLEGGDPVGVGTAGGASMGEGPPSEDGFRAHLPLRARPGHRTHLFRELDRVSGGVPDPSRAFRLSRGVEGVLRHLPRTGRLLLFTDLLAFDDEVDRLVSALRVVGARGGEATVVRVADPAELGLESPGDGPFLDPEDGAMDPRTPDPGFASRVEAHYRELTGRLEGAGVQVVLLTTDLPLLTALHRWMGRG